MAIRKKLTKGGKEEPPRLQRYEILDRIEQIKGYKATRNKAMISLLYLTGCRIEEVCNYIIERRLDRTITKVNKDGKKTQVREPIFKRRKVGNSIIKKQFEFTRDSILIHNVRCLKRRKRVTRSIPIVYTRQEEPFIKYVLDYLKILEPEDKLFPITRSRANQILEKVDLYPHYLRHLRATHLVTSNGFDTEHLKKFFGWSSGETAANYVHLNVDDIIHKLRVRK